MARLYFRYAAMNAGKSTALLQVAHNYEETGRRVVIYTAAIDDRYGTGLVTSRLGPQRPARTFATDTDFYRDIADMKGTVDCILLDEAQFLRPEHVRQLHQAAHLLDVPVICYGLRSDFRGEVFPGAAALLGLADELEQLRTICRCSRRATMNMRLDENGHRVREGESVLIGGNARYAAVCGRCFWKEA